MYVLGIDTSNYTTSVCAVDCDTGQMVAEARQVLPVAPGENGLRQSDALFLHTQQLPVVLGRLRQQLSLPLGQNPWSALAVSVRPRPFAKSYMPVFSFGEHFVTTMALALGVPLVRTSHQEGHIAAAEYFADRLLQGLPHFAVHLSGGTSDILFAKQTKYGYHITLLGESLDLHAGQFVDRVGVKLGLPFPAGPELERLAATAPRRDVRIPTRVKGAQMSFSGPCTAALRAVDGGTDPCEIAFAVEQAIANSVIKGLSHAHSMYPDVTYAVIAGGVAANEHIRQRVTARLKVLCPGLRILYAPARFSSDNALGIATIGYRHVKNL
jgi:N6-L-threonylcarbamoyladenine synthase